MNRSAGGMLAIVIVASFMARSSVSRPDSSPQLVPKASGGQPASQNHLKGKTTATDKTTPDEGSAAWSVPPDPRCFLIRTIADFYGSQELVSGGSFLDAYKDVPKGCDPQPISEAPPRRDSVPRRSTPAITPPSVWGVPQGSKKSPIRFVIATVADPVRSHLSLYFDRSVDAVQQGAQAAGYVFSRAAMPWDWEQHEPPADLPTKLAWNHYQREKEKLPGLMIFRKIPPRPPFEETEDLFVWIVGETPTGGIHKQQFDSALQIMRAIAPTIPSPGDQAHLSILGPTFSGSLPSLHDLLQNLRENPIPFRAKEEEKQKQGTKGKPTDDDVVVHSGTVESEAWSNWFRNVPGGLPAFVSFQENDTDAECAFLRYVVDRNFSLKDVAELSEDETAFGGGGMEMAPTSQRVCSLEDPGSGGGRERDILHLKFPREISRLRAAYQSEIQQVPENATGGKPAPRTTLPLDLQDSGSDEDSVPTYAHAQYPLSQESVMLAITTALRAHHSLFIVLKASDPIDTLFLVRFLRQDYPQGRIVTFGSDLLYRREVEDDLLHGIMAITLYSLQPRADDQLEFPWCRKDEQHIDRLFPSSDSAGEYNAMLSLLPPVTPCSAIAGANEIPAGPFTEFGWPSIGGNPQSIPLKPVLWFTALGRDAYWPVAIWPSDLPAMSGASFRPRFHLPKPPSWLLLQALTFVLCFTLGYLLCQGTLLTPSETVAHFAPIRGLWRLRLLALLCFLALLALALATLPWGWWLGMTWPCMKWPLRILIVVGWLGLANFPRRHLRQRQAGKRLQRTYAGCVIALPVVALVVWYLADGQAPTSNPFFFRYIHVTSGVSLLPCALLLVLAGLWWAWHSLQGLSSLDGRRPRLPKAGENERWQTGLYSLTEEGNRPLLHVLSPSFFAAKQIYIPVAFAVFVSFCVVAAETKSIGLHPVQTLEFCSIDFLFFLAHLAIACVLVAELARLTVCWMELRQPLRTLDRLPLRRAFRELKGFSWNWLWSLEGGSVQDGYRASSRELEALQHLRLSAGKSSTDFVLKTVVHRIQGLLKAVRLPHAAGKKRNFEWTRELLGEVANLHLRLADLCRDDLELLQASWAMEAKTSLFFDANPKSGPDKAVPEETRKREQFVALVYVNFLVTVLLRMRTIIVTIAGLYILLPLSLSLYPVEPKVILRALLIILFFVIVTVVGIVYGQMHKDSVLSCLTDTTPGELGTDFYLKMASFIVLPLISLLVSQFPDVNSFLFSWLQPAMQALNH